MNAAPFDPRHILMTDPPLDLDVMAQEALLALSACRALGLPPAELEAAVKALVRGARRLVAANHQLQICDADFDEVEVALALFKEVPDA
jgi:hypothetical protein